LKVLLDMRCFEALRAWCEFSVGVAQLRIIIVFVDPMLSKFIYLFLFVVFFGLACAEAPTIIPCFGRFA
jgi:hypothetical protein